MTAFDAGLAAEVHGACQQNAQEIAEALDRALGARRRLAFAPPTSLPEGKWPSEFKGPHLILTWSLDERGAALFVPALLAPAWANAPDATGRSQLATLGQELGILLFPEPFMALDARFFWTDDIREILHAESAAAPRQLLPLRFGENENPVNAWFVWPVPFRLDQLRRPAQVAARGGARGEPDDAAGAGAVEGRAAPPGAGGDPFGENTVFSQLGPKPTARTDPMSVYLRSLLRIQVPVMVTLASTRQPVSKILELAPGTIIQFEKSCEETLILGVGNQDIAVGQAVKVGDKFGLRVASIKKPLERFHAVVRHRSDQAATRAGEK